jgi:hypothetical protein
MKIGTFAIAAGALALGLATWITPGRAQGPLYDVVHVNLPYTVSIADRTLQPGEYTIQQLRDPGGASRVLLIYSDNGMKFETSAMTIPVLDPNTARDTKVMLHHFGPEYYFDKIWIQGKDYGYEFPLPASVKSRQREAMEPVSVAATYSTTPAQPETATTTTTTTAQSQTAQSATTTPSTTTTTTTAPATTMAQNTPPATQTPATTQTTTPPATTTSTATANNTANRAMPATSAGWLMMLLGGGALSGVGLGLRRRR